MRIAVNLGPTPSWTDVVEGARRADAAGLDAVSLLDHYHSENPDWGWVSGLAAYGALAMATSRVKLVPMVLDRLNYLPGVLAKETAVLSQLSDGRFELGIGAGDYFVEQSAWGLSVPDATARIDALGETLTALRKVWAGQPVTMSGSHVQLTGALCLPAPQSPPKIVVGAGNSRRLIRSACAYADELNVYADDATITAARSEIDKSGRAVDLSVYVWDWPDDIAARLAAWAEMGVGRVFLTVWPPFDRIAEAAALQH